MKELESTENSAAECTVQLILSHTMDILEIRFSSNPSPTNPKQATYSELITTFILDNSSLSIDSDFKYKCSTTDNCHREFVLNRIRRFVNENYTDLQLAFIRILIKKRNDPIQCFTTASQTEYQSCQNAACNAQLDLNAFPEFNISNIINDCGSPKRKSTSVRITTNSNNLNFISKHQIFYTCMFNGCNNVSTSHDIFYTIQNLYNVSYIIYGENTARNITSTTKREINTTTTAFAVLTDGISTVYMAEETLTTQVNRLDMSSTVSIATRHLQSIMHIFESILFYLLMILLRSPSIIL